jgi:asparagine synthase (glutamine-hydrolysing)
MLPPGAWQVIDVSGDRLSIGLPHIWWRPPQPDFSLEAVDFVLRTREILDEAIRDHLISDVPVGVFLSAGLDSASIAGLAARHSRETLTFTVGFEDTGIDEVGLAAETASHFGLRHSAIRITNPTAEQSACEWLAAADQPSMDGLNTFVIAKAVREYGIKVALCGLGADELFGGYPSFTEVPRLRQLARLIAWLPPAARGTIAGAFAMRESPVVQGKLRDMLGGHSDLVSLALQRRRLLNNRQLADLGLPAHRLGLGPRYLPPEAQALLPPTDVAKGWTISFMESQFYQTNMLLRDSDANGMAHGLEIRVPFLDQRLVDWIYRLPDKMRFPRHSPPKHLLRRALDGVLPGNLLSRPKTGFVLPLGRWMLGPLRTMCEKGLAALKESDLVRPAGVDTIWKSFIGAPNSQMWSRALVLASLGNYLLKVK